MIFGHFWGKYHYGLHCIGFWLKFEAILIRFIISEPLLGEMIAYNLKKSSISCRQLKTLVRLPRQQSRRRRPAD